MPNWCENILTISLNENTKEAKEQLKSFVKDVSGMKNSEGDIEPIQIRKLIPTPEELVGTTSPVTVVSDKDYKRIHKNELATFNRRKKKNPDYDFRRFSISESISKDLISKYGANNWYDWNIRNWGVKWDVAYSSFQGIHKDVATYTFDTAWCPPIQAFETISKMYPLLLFEIRYEEPGCCFRGVAEFQNGETADSCENYEPEDEKENEE